MTEAHTEPVPCTCRGPSPAERAGCVKHGRAHTEPVSDQRIEAQEASWSCACPNAHDPTRNRAWCSACGEWCYPHPAMRCVRGALAATEAALDTAQKVNKRLTDTNGFLGKAYRAQQEDIQRWTDNASEYARKCAEQEARAERAEREERATQDLWRTQLARAERAEATLERVREWAEHHIDDPHGCERCDATAAAVLGEATPEGAATGLRLGPPLCCTLGCWVEVEKDGDLCAEHATPEGGAG